MARIELEPTLSAKNADKGRAPSVVEGVGHLWSNERSTARYGSTL